MTGPAFAREEYRRDFRKALPLPSGRALRIENSNGRVTVRTQPKAEVEIVAAIRCSADTAAEARSFAEQTQIVVSDAGGVSVRTQYPTRNWRNISFSVDYDILMPETAPLDLRNRFGAVSVVNLHAPATISSGNGSVYFSGGRGRQEIENSFGDVEVRTNDGDLVVRNGNGAVTAADITGSVEITDRFGKVRVANAGRAVTIRSNNGEIDASNVGGPVQISNSFGAVTVTDARGDVNVQNQNGAVRATGIAGAAELHTSFERVSFSRIGKTLTVRATNSTVTGDTVGASATVETSFGGVDLRGVKGGARVTAGNSGVRLASVGGEVYAKTSFNEVRVSDAPGPITVENQNGSVTVEAGSGKGCQPISLHTSFGPIRVTVPGGIGYNVTARTSFGRIHSTADMLVTGDVGGDQLSGKIAGGGCELRLMDQNGSIDILK